MNRVVQLFVETFRTFRFTRFTKGTDTAVHTAVAGPRSALTHGPRRLQPGLAS
jgi:hypothetical protein